MYTLEFSNRDSDTHMEHRRDEIGKYRQPTRWERDLISSHINKDQYDNTPEE